MDKQLIEGPDGKPLGPFLAGELSALFPEVLVATRRPELYPGSRAIADIIPGFGILSGLHAALNASRSPWLYLAACDMPLVSAEWIGFLADKIRMAEAAAKAKPHSGAEASSEIAGLAPFACLARYESHFEPFHAFYSRSLIPALEKLFRDSGPRDGGKKRPSVKELFAAAEHEAIGYPLFIPEAEARKISPEWRLFFNINEPSELERFRSAK